MTRDCLGADLHVGDVVHDAGGDYTIDHFGPYPGRFVGDQARIAYFVGGGEHTVCDHRHFDVVEPAPIEMGEAA